ncbi:MAG: septum formation inhibitor [Saprospiraceae bacterium]|nr:septum formation inhibitor [Saprospiraceae bacterium]
MAQSKKIKQDIAGLLGISTQWINKYTISGMVFLVWILFLDKHNFFAFRKLQGTIHKMEMEKVELSAQIDQALLDKKDLEENQEKYAREKHLMHKENEEIILIEQKKK